MPEKGQNYSEHTLRQAARDLIEGHASAELEDAARKIWGTVTPAPAVRSATLPPPAPRETVREVREVKVERIPGWLPGFAAVVALVLAGLGGAQIYFTLQRESKGSSSQDKI
jgi:hypothetical protein